MKYSWLSGEWSVLPAGGSRRNTSCSIALSGALNVTNHVSRELPRPNFSTFRIWHDLPSLWLRYRVSVSFVNCICPPPGPIRLDGARRLYACPVWCDARFDETTVG